MAVTRIDGRRDGRFYEVEGELLASVTNILGCVNKPALVPWAANRERELVLEAAGDLWDDAPTDPKMSRLSFVTSLRSRLSKTRAHVKEMEAAQQVGTAAHAFIEWTLRKELGQEVGPPPAMSDKSTWAFLAFQKWREQVKLEPLWVEQTVYSKRHGYAGTLDLVAYLELKDESRDYGRTLAVIDFKTSKAIYSEARWQVAAYSWAYHLMGHSETVIPGVILRLPKVETDPEFEAQIVHEVEMPNLFEKFLAIRDVWLGVQKEEEKRQARMKPKPVESATSEPPSQQLPGALPGIMVSTMPKDEAEKLAARREHLKNQARQVEGK